MTPIKIDLLIIGTGPAGSSTALHLLQTDQTWEDRMLLIDKAIHPREKLCGGGIVHFGENILTDLGLPFDPPNFEVKEVRLKYEEKSYSFRGDPVFRIVHRAEFDHWLLQQVEARGGRVHQGETVIDVVPHAEFISVKTDKAVYHAQAIVAADGSRSLVRQKLKWNSGTHVARLIEVLTPETLQSSWEFRDGVAVFDFSQMTSHSVQGYYWDFPSVVDGNMQMNRGVFDSRARPEREKADLKKTLKDSMASRERTLDPGNIKGHPIRWLNLRGELSRPRILLAGDAAGADPLFGEGISTALAYGRVAAAEISYGFERSDLSFRHYKRRVLRDSILFTVVIRVLIAQFAYRLKTPRLFSIGWSIARFIIRLTPWRNESFIPARVYVPSKSPISMERSQ